MKNFLFVYRSEPNNNQPSPEEMQASAIKFDLQ